MDKLFHHPLYYTCDCVSILRFKLLHVSKRDPRQYLIDTLRSEQNARHFADNISNTFFFNEKFLYIASNFTKVCSQGSNWLFISSGLGNGLVLDRQKDIIWTNDCHRDKLSVSFWTERSHWNTLVAHKNSNSDHWTQYLCHQSYNKCDLSTSCQIGNTGNHRGRM